MSIDFSYTATWKERERYENNLTLGVNGQGPMPGPMKNRADFPQAVHQLTAVKQQVEKPNPHIIKHCDSDNQSKKKHNWNVNGNDGDGTIGHNILPPLQPGGRHRNGKNGKNNLCSFALKKEQPSFVQGVSLTGNSDSLVCDEVCKQHTAPRGPFTCHTQFFSCARGSSSGAQHWTGSLGCTSCEL